MGSPNMTVRSLRYFQVVVSKRLGHSNVSITSEIYAHSLPSWQRQAAEAMEGKVNSRLELV